MILIGLGSNIGEREKNIQQAINKLANNEHIRIDKISALYETEPVGVKEQPNFLNAAVRITTKLSPRKLLEFCQVIESEMGRVRNMVWGPRNIDIDILVFDDIVMQTALLTIPHPRIQERKFVLIPLSDISDNIPIVDGFTATELLAKTSDTSEVALYRKSCN